MTSDFSHNMKKKVLKIAFEAGTSQIWGKIHEKRGLSDWA